MDGNNASGMSWHNGVKSTTGELTAYDGKYSAALVPWSSGVFEMHFVDVSESGQEHAMVLGIRYVDAAVHEEQTQKQLLQDALEAANRASAAKSDFMSKMSHECSQEQPHCPCFSRYALSSVL